MKPSRLKWACRRGMLELDLMLLPYAEGAYPGLSEAEQAHFDEFLDSGDQDLFDWLMGKKDAEPNFQGIVQEVREYAQKSRSAG